MKNNIKNSKIKKSNFNKEKMITIRKEIGFSQEDVADLIQVSRQTISAWESGKSVPTIDNISKLTKLFKISIEDLTFSQKSTISTSNLDTHLNTGNNSKRKKIKIVIIIFLLIILLSFFIPPFTRGIYYITIQNKLKPTYNINNYYYKIFEYTLDENNNQDVISTSVYFKDNITKHILQTENDTIIHWIDHNNNERIYVSRI